MWLLCLKKVLFYIETSFSQERGDIILMLFFIFDNRAI